MKAPEEENKEQPLPSLKGNWTPFEDLRLDFYFKETPYKWKIISDKLAEEGINKAGKQCRERWLNYKDPQINHKDWKQEEIDLLFQLHKEFKSQWVKISTFFEGRPQNAVKNAFNFHYSRANKFMLAKFHSMKIKKEKFSDRLLEKISEDMGTTMNRLSTVSQKRLESYISKNYKRTDNYKSNPEYIEKQKQKLTHKKLPRLKRLEYNKSSPLNSPNNDQIKYNNPFQQSNDQKIEVPKEPKEPKEPKGPQKQKEPNDKIIENPVLEGEYKFLIPRYPSNIQNTEKNIKFNKLIVDDQGILKMVENEGMLGNPKEKLKIPSLNAPNTIVNQAVNYGPSSEAPFDINHLLRTSINWGTLKNRIYEDFLRRFNQNKK